MKKRKSIKKTLCSIVALCMMFTAALPYAFVSAEESDESADTAEEVVQSYLETEGQLYVGAAIECISPLPDMYPIERKASTDVVGIIEDTHVRVIAIGDGTTTSLILNFEMGRGPYGPQYVAALSEHTGIDPDEIFLTAGHIHASPEITEETDLEGDSNQERWAAYVMDQMLIAADEALANMEPAEYGIGSSQCYINANRNANYTDEDGNPYRSYGFNGEGYTNHTLTTIQFRSLETGDTIAIMYSYAIHNIVMNANEFFDPDFEGITYTADEKYADTGVCGLHPDVCGLVSLYFEENYEGSVAMFLCGAAGDQGPIVMNQIWTPDPKTGEQQENYIAGASVEICEYLAKWMYADLETALNSIENFSTDMEISYAYGTTDIPGTDENPESTAMGLQVLRLNDIVLAGTVGEHYASTGDYLAENSSYDNTLLINCVWNTHETRASYYPDADAAIYGSANGTPRYDAEQMPILLSELLNDLIDETEGDWLIHGDGTATSKTTGETIIVGLDGKAGTDDDNQIINPAGKVLLENVAVSTDAAGEHYVSLGNGFKLYAGEDGILGTTDDLVMDFGSYQQNVSDEETTIQRKEGLNWRLLDIEDGKAVLITEKVIDAAAFNLDASEGNDWSTSNLRAWLNSEGGVSSSGNEEGFYDTAFSDDEKAKIVLTEVNMDSDEEYIAYNRTKDDDWWEYYTTTGSPSSDYVWALSGEEAFEYFGRSTIATEEELGHDPANYTNGYFVPTEFAHEEVGVKINEGDNGESFIGFGDSWTRSPGRDVDEDGSYYGVFWGSTGSLNSGRTVDREYGVMPVVTVDLGEDDSNWIYNGDGTATDRDNSETVIVGLDEVAGTQDDNQIVNPAKKVLIEQAEISYDGDGTVYVDLGNGFSLYGGADGMIGTTDDVVADFGSYPQSDETGETAEPLDWRLLDIEDGVATLLSAKVIDAISFNLEPTDGNTWADSNIRAWLNSTGGVSFGGDTVGFYDRAFTDEEKEKIVLTEVRCDYSDYELWTLDDPYNYLDTTGDFPGYDRTIEYYELYTTTGENTYDYVYAISGEEVFAYFSQGVRMNPEFYDLTKFRDGYFEATPYALTQGAKFNSSPLQWMFNGNADSWTRSEGREMDEDGNYYGIFWGSYGNMNTGRTVETNYGVLPMLNVSLEG